MAIRISVEAVVNDERGIHARPSAMIVKACSRYGGAVTVSRVDDPEGREYDCRAMMDLIEMGATQGTRLRFFVERPDIGDAREADLRAQAFCDELTAIVSMTLDEIEAAGSRLI